MSVSNSKYNWKAFELLLKKVVVKGGYTLPIETCDIIMEFLRCKVCFINEPNYKWYKKAAEMNKISVIKAIPSWDCKKMPVNQLLHIACESETHNNVDLVKYLLEKGANLKLKGGTRNDKPLHNACYYGNINVVKYLVEEKGLHVKTKGNRNNTLLDIAYSTGNVDMVKYIESKGERLSLHNLTEKVIYTPKIYKSLDMVKYLVEKYQVNMEATNIYNKTPFHIACQYGTLNVVKYLVEEGVNIEARNIYNNTPFHMACQEGNLDVVKYLVEEKGLNVETRGFRNYTPLQFAYIKGCYKVVEYLVEQGANITA